METPTVLEPDGLEKLVLTRGLLMCCKVDILSCQLESFTHKVGDLKPNSQGLGEPLERAAATGGVFSPWKARSCPLPESLCSHRPACCWMWSFPLCVP